MALRIKDPATATSLVAVKTVHSLGANWMRKDKHTPNYPSLGLLHGYKLADHSSLHRSDVQDCGAMTTVRQTIGLLDCFMATSWATDSATCNACFTMRKSTLNVDAERNLRLQSRLTPR
jgi:hypothetical protein